MSTSATHSSIERHDVRTILTGGVSLGLITVAGVVVFALLSRALSGVGEVVVQSLVILVGGALATCWPARAVRPRTIDAIGWRALTGLLGAVVFTVIDTIVLRPVKLYDWTWDAIGGGSGWWYIPVWFMGSAFLAWLGAWAYACRARSASEVNLLSLGLQTGVIAAVIFAALAATSLSPFRSPVAALAFAIAVVIQVPISAVLSRR